MAIYTVSPDLLRNIEKHDGIYFTDILFVFSSRSNKFRVSIDKKGHIINLYKSIEKNADIIKIWLDFMSFSPSKFEENDVDFTDINCEETKFLKVCKETKTLNNIIYYSKQNVNNKFVCEGEYIIFEEKAIKILDREDAKFELTILPINTGDSYVNSQVAQGKSKINKSKNI